MDTGNFKYVIVILRMYSCNSLFHLKINQYNAARLQKLTFKIDILLKIISTVSHKSIYQSEILALDIQKRI